MMRSILRFLFLGCLKMQKILNLVCNVLYMPEIVQGLICLRLKTPGRLLWIWWWEEKIETRPLFLMGWEAKAIIRRCKWLRPPHLLEFWDNFGMLIFIWDPSQLHGGGRRKQKLGRYSRRWDERGKSNHPALQKVAPAPQSKQEFVLQSIAPKMRIAIT